MSGRAIVGRCGAGVYVWYVYGGKLYLNVSPRYQREWPEDIDGDITRAEANWPGILGNA